MKTATVNVLAILYALSVWVIMGFLVYNRWGQVSGLWETSEMLFTCCYQACLWPVWVPLGFILGWY